MSDMEFPCLSQLDAITAHKIAMTNNAKMYSLVNLLNKITNSISRAVDHGEFKSEVSMGKYSISIVNESIKRLENMGYTVDRYNTISYLIVSWDKGAV